MSPRDAGRVGQRKHGDRAEAPMEAMAASHVVADNGLQMEEQQDGTGGGFCANHLSHWLKEQREARYGALRFCSNGIS